MKKDKEWLNIEIVKLQKEANTRNEYGSNYSDEQLALKKVLSLIDQLDEPNKPVVPQFVADWIESYRSRTLAELIHDAVYGDTKDVKAFRRWFHAEYGYETNYSEFLARVWLDGYEVGKEKKYYVLDSEDIPLLERANNQTCKTTTALSVYEDGRDNSRFALTEKEIKDYDPRFWQFAVPVEEEAE